MIRATNPKLLIAILNFTQLGKTKDRGGEMEIKKNEERFPDE